MMRFIKKQIDSYGNKKFNMNDYIDQFKERYTIISIKNNKIFSHTYKKNNNMDNSRIPNLYEFIKLLLKKYTLDDTILFFNTRDGFSFEDFPVFNYAVPFNKKGLIMPEFDILHFKSNQFHNRNINSFKKKANRYIPNHIDNDMFLIGSSTTRKRNNLREMLSKEDKPFNIKILGNKIRIDMWEYKKHKYLLDLPGVKPWSIRLKYLLFLERLIIRIAFYCSKFDEQKYYRLWFDYLIKPNRDYILLNFDFDYDHKIPQNVYNQIKKKMLQTYYFMEKNPKIYDKIVKNMKKSSKNITVDESLDYMYHLIQSYTKNLLL